MTALHLQTPATAEQACEYIADHISSKQRAIAACYAGKFENNADLIEDIRPMKDMLQKWIDEHGDRKCGLCWVIDQMKAKHAAGDYINFRRLCFLLMETEQALYRYALDTYPAEATIRRAKMTSTTKH